MIFAFDVGIQSLGIAVNKDGDIIHAESLLIPAGAASVSDEAERRRQFRTRQSHKERERVLEQLWRDIGKQPLQRKAFEGKGKHKKKISDADEKLEREFPSHGDETVYASSLLRIMLLEGKPLEDWQIYKALHASIQRRGYDPNVPWRRSAETDKSKKEESEHKKQSSELKEKLKEMTKEERYHLPCYWDAYQMGLWCNKKKSIISFCQSAEREPRRARKHLPTRQMVEDELRQLLEKAAERVPELKKHVSKMDAIIYGKQDDASLDRRYPSAKAITGLLGQKYPRFDNRIVGKCALIPRLNVCRANKPLAIECGFLLRLVNFRYEREGEILPLLPREIREIYEEIACTAYKEAFTSGDKLGWNCEKLAEKFKITKAKLAKKIELLSGNMAVGHEEIQKSKINGRSRFSQPALFLIKKCILEGKDPKSFGKECQRKLKKEANQKKSEFGYYLSNEGKSKNGHSPVTDAQSLRRAQEDSHWKYKYFPKDFDFFDRIEGGRVYIPDVSLAEKYGTADGIGQAIQRVLSGTNWPELRHRLGVFLHSLEDLTKRFGKPDAVHIEFVREDFMSDEKKKKYLKQSNKGKDARTKAKEELRERLGIQRHDENLILRYRLLEEQKYQCPYTGDSLMVEEIKSYEIDHIYPRDCDGPDAYYNKVLTKEKTNGEKDKRLPFDFFKDTNRNWECYKERVRNIYSGREHARKRKYLTATLEEAKQMTEKYTGLAATAYIARMARDIVCLYYGWQPAEKDEGQKVFVFSGGLTSKVAKKYDLYQALSDGSSRKIKPRDDHRHHALDAMIISYLQQWARDKNKTEFFKFPKGVTVDYFRNKLQSVNPKYIGKRKARIEAGAPKSTKDKKFKYEKFHNLSKDPGERGQYYTNKKIRQGKKKGTYQHGYWFYIEGKKGKVKSNTVHSFRSPYSVRKGIVSQWGENSLLGLFYSNLSIYLTKQQSITGTQLGRKVRFIVNGEYEIIKEGKNNITISPHVRATQKNEDDAPPRFRMNTENPKIKAYLKRNLSSSENNHENKRFLINKAFIEELKPDFWKDEIPSMEIPEDYYLIKKFSNGGKIIFLTARDGTIYRVNSDILRFASIDKQKA